MTFSLSASVVLAVLAVGQVSVAHPGEEVFYSVEYDLPQGGREVLITVSTPEGGFVLTDLVVTDRNSMAPLWQGAVGE